MVQQAALTEPCYKHRFKTMSEVQDAGTALAKVLAQKLTRDELEILREVVDANSVNQDFFLDLCDVLDYGDVRT